MRLEQISPFPYDKINEECKKYSNALLIWAQEEHKNMGAWAFIQPRFLSLLKKFINYFFFFLSLFKKKTFGNYYFFSDQRKIIYAGRKPSASPATGNKYSHLKEQKEMFDAIFNASV